LRAYNFDILWEIKRIEMTAKMNNNFINYFDFLDILVQTFNTAPRELFEKMIEMILSTLHQQTISLEKEALQIDEMNIIPFDDLEEYYDTVLEEIEDIKLLKKRVLSLKDRDILFDKFYNALDRLHQAFILNIDRVGQLEIRVLSKEQSA